MQLGCISKAGDRETGVDTGRYVGWPGRLGPCPIVAAANCELLQCLKRRRRVWIRCATTGGALPATCVQLLLSKRLMPWCIKASKVVEGDGCVWWLVTGLQDAAYAVSKYTFHAHGVGQETLKINPRAPSQVHCSRFACTFLPGACTGVQGVLYSSRHFSTVAGAVRPAVHSRQCGGRRLVHLESTSKACRKMTAAVVRHESSHNTRSIGVSKES